MNAAATAGPPRIALVDNPNCDKNALFNLLPDARQKVANYAGVTAECKEGRARLPDGIIALVDATNLRLLLAVARLGPTHDAGAERGGRGARGLQIDIARLSAELGMPVVETVAVHNPWFAAWRDKTARAVVMHPVAGLPRGR